MNVDFPAARRQIDEQSQFPASTRRAAFAAYASLFDFADADGCVSTAAERLAAAIGTSRVTWLELRRVLEAAGLVVVSGRRGGRVPPVLQVRPPRPV